MDEAHHPHPVGSGAEPLLEWLIRPTAEPPSFSDLSTWWVDTESTREAWPLPFDAAVVGGFLGDRLACAFVSGYRAALRRLIPALDAADVAALCVTEAEGNHPRAIRARLDPDTGGGFRLTGTKRWASGADQAGLLLVAARAGDRPDRRPDIRLVSVPAEAPGVDVTRMAPAPFVPEISHCQVELEDVRVGPGAILPGDGYADYIRPFRTIEDIHVSGGMLGHLFGMATELDWPTRDRQAIIALVLTFRSLATASPDAPAIHVGLAGALELTDRLNDWLAPRWEVAPVEVRRRWERDRPLLGVAGRARARRTERAWARLATPSRLGP